MIGTRLYKNTDDMMTYSRTADWCNRNNAIILDKGEYYEVAEYAPPAPSEHEVLYNETETLKAYLSDTDWCVIKCVEMGLSMAVKYPEVHQRRMEARARINEIESIMDRSES